MFHGKFPTAHKSAEHDPEGEEHGPDPTCGDFQELRRGEEHMEISALLLVPFIPWHGAEDASLIPPAGQMLTGFCHGSSSLTVQGETIMERPKTPVAKLRFSSEG